MKLVASLALTAFLFSSLAIAETPPAGQRKTASHSVKSCDGKKGKALKACIKSAKLHKKKKKSKA